MEEQRQELERRRGKPRQIWNEDVTKLIKGRRLSEEDAENCETWKCVARNTHRERKRLGEEDNMPEHWSRVRKNDRKLMP
jgi:hypothetical protein